MSAIRGKATLSAASVLQRFSFETPLAESIIETFTTKLLTTRRAAQLKERLTAGKERSEHMNINVFLFPCQTYKSLWNRHAIPPWWALKSKTRTIKRFFLCSWSCFKTPASLVCLWMKNELKMWIGTHYVVNASLRKSAIKKQLSAPK